jgi:hypothetical protein
MARFAIDCIELMDELMRGLEVFLGPGTTDLAMRIGMHSGPTTGGVLRGEKSRFQLFGDTVNTAARMESSGKPNMIQMSEHTANLLKARGKTSWIRPREDKIVAKGKGEMTTFWLVLRSGRSSCGESSRCDVSGHEFSERYDDFENRDGLGAIQSMPNQRIGLDGEEDRRRMADKVSRLVDWNVDVLQRLLIQIVAKRNASRSSQSCADPVTSPKCDADIIG